MVGRTPEYLGKKIQAREVQLVMLYVLVFPATVLTMSALAVVMPAGLKGLNNSGPHGLSEILYAFSSTAANNGSAFAGLSGGTYFYNTLFGVSMLIGRFTMMVPVIALGGIPRRKTNHAGIIRHVSSNLCLVCRAAHYSDSYCRRPHLFPGTRAWTDC